MYDGAARVREYRRGLGREVKEASNGKSMGLTVRG